MTVAPAFPTSYTFLTQFVATAELVFEFSYLSLSLFLFLSSPSSHTNLSPRHPSSSFPSFVHISSTHVIGSIRGVPINPQGVSLDRWLTENTIVYHTDPLSLHALPSPSYTLSSSQYAPLKFPSVSREQPRVIARASPWCSQCVSYIVT